MAALILAFDLGTTGNKASLFAADGYPLASQVSAYPTAYARPGWAEQNPEDWWASVCEATAGLLASSKHSAEDIAVVSFSGQMMACLPVDAAGIPLRPALIWADSRAEEEARWLAERVGGERVYAVTGHRASASYTAAKALWLRAHEPEVWARTAHLLQAKDYVAYRLTGEYATDYSDASGTNLFDLEGRAWSVEIADAIGLDLGLLPAARPSATVIGTVSARAAVETGLRPGTPVVIGGGDGACATAGAGVVGPGDAYCYLGSSSWIAYVSRAPLLDPAQRTFTFAHLDPAYLFPTGTMQAAGASFDWLERLLRGGGEEYCTTPSRPAPGTFRRAPTASCSCLTSLANAAHLEPPRPRRLPGADHEPRPRRDGPRRPGGRSPEPAPDPGRLPRAGRADPGAPPDRWRGALGRVAPDPGRCTRPAAPLAHPPCGGHLPRRRGGRRRWRRAVPGLRGRPRDRPGAPWRGAYGGFCGALRGDLPPLPRRPTPGWCRSTRAWPAPRAFVV